MATRKSKNSAKATIKRNDMKFFADTDDQDSKDLNYGAQKAGCKDVIKRNKKKNGYVDPSLSGDWTPETD